LARYSNHENGAGFCLLSAACLDEHRPTASLGRQRGERAAFLLLWQEDFLLRRQKFPTGVVARAGDSGDFASKSSFSPRTRDSRLGVAQRRGA
jgi:hypothetical protein